MMNPLFFIGIAGAAFYAGRNTAPPARVEIECADDGSGFNVATVAGALVSACRACDQLEPVLEPLAAGQLPITELSRLLTSPLRGGGKR